MGGQANKINRDELLRLLREDEELRLAVMGLLGIVDVQSSLRQLINAINKLAEAQTRSVNAMQGIAEGETRITEMLGKVTDMLAKINEMIMDLAETLSRTIDMVERLAKGQEELGSAIKQLTEVQRVTWEAVKQLIDGEGKILDLLRQSLDSQGRLWQEVRVLQEGQNNLLVEVKRLGENIERLWQEVKAMREEETRLREGQERLWERYDRLDRKLSALGARWGVFSEEAFRRTIEELLSGVGYKVEKWSYNDAEGYVFGYPSVVDLDIVIRDDKAFAVEIKSSVSRSDLVVFKRIAELYERVTGRRLDAKYLVTYFIGERDEKSVIDLANSLGIKIVEPEELTRQ